MAADYAWSRPDINLNYDLEAGTGPSWTDWTASASVAVISGASAYGGSGESANIPDTEDLQQDVPISDANGRRISLQEDLRLDFAAKPLSTLCDGLGIQVMLYDSTTLKYTYNFHDGKWEAPDDTVAAPAEDDQSTYWLSLDNTAYSDWTLFDMPRIYAISEAGSDVADSWLLRIKLRVDNHAGAAAMGVDNIRLSYWASTVESWSVGQYTVFSNGHNYPVKHDTKSATISELSLHPPYAGSNSLPTVTTATTGGSLEDDLYYGYIYAFVDPRLTEYSALPLGVQTSSGAFTQQVGTGTNTHTISTDYSALELPNSENNKTTDNTVGTRVVQWRTMGYVEQQDAEDDVYAGLVYFEAEAAVAGTIVSTLSDDDLKDQGGLSDFASSLIQIPCPQFTIGHAFRSRLWVAGGREYKNGFAVVTQNSDEVVGITTGTATAPTYWGRGTNYMTFQRDSDGRQYDIEEYWYHNDDGSSGVERIVLTEDYAGATSSGASYTIRPKDGRVWFSEEGNPASFSTGGFLLLDGAEGDAVTMIGHAGQYLVACTKNATFVYNYTEYPNEGGKAMTAISRDLGCIAPRSFTEIDGTSYWLSSRGPVKCTGASVELLDPALRDMFTDPDDDDYVLRRAHNQLADDCVGAHDVANQSWVLAIRTRTSKQGCNVAIVYNYVYQTWDILRYNNGIGSLQLVDDDNGNPRLCMTDSHGHSWKMNVGLTDGVGEVNNTGQLRGKVVTGTLVGANISSASYLYVAAFGLNGAGSSSMNLDGVYIKAIAGTGKGDVRRIHHSNATTVFWEEAVDTAWDTTTVWELGGIEWAWEFKKTDLGLPAHVKSMSFMEIDQGRQGATGRATVKVYPDNETVDWNTHKGLLPRRFPTGVDGRRMVGLDDAAGYVLRVQISGEGPNNPLEIRHLAATMDTRERD